MGRQLENLQTQLLSASISEIEPFLRNNRQYYKISLFVGYDDISAVEGNFTITPSTRCLETVYIGSSVISVDSTIGFPENGKIISGKIQLHIKVKVLTNFLNVQEF